LGKVWVATLLLHAYGPDAAALISAARGEIRNPRPLPPVLWILVLVSEAACYTV
jgi:hypothetical protein